MKSTGPLYQELVYPSGHKTVAGRRSERAERLVAFCLGVYADTPPPVCSENRYYLKNKFVHLFRNGFRRPVLRANPHRELRDQKKIVEAWIAQGARIPPFLSCWLIRGDSAGAGSDSERGLHFAGMRHPDHRHLVLAPTANRERFLGPLLASQMEEIRGDWTPWEEKSNAVWWGGALTGSHWADRPPHPLTRRAVLGHFNDNPSERVRLHLSEIPQEEHADGFQAIGRFEKRDAFRHKALLLLPGHDIASGSSWAFSGNSVVMMPEPHLEHILYFEMAPWEHYVPVDNDPADVPVKLDWVLGNQNEAQRIVARAHERLRWLAGPEYLWACNEVLRRVAPPLSTRIRRRWKLR